MDEKDNYNKNLDDSGGAGGHYKRTAVKATIYIVLIHPKTFISTRGLFYFLKLGA
jgi:hypothetical protein